MPNTDVNCKYLTPQGGDNDKWLGICQFDVNVMRHCFENNWAINYQFKL